MSYLRKPRFRAELGHPVIGVAGHRVGGGDRAERTDQRVDDKALSDNGIGNLADAAASRRAAAAPMPRDDPAMNTVRVIAELLAVI
jgi:hypothetical protein